LGVGRSSFQMMF